MRLTSKVGSMYVKVGLPTSPRDHGTPSNDSAWQPPRPALSDARNVDAVPTLTVPSPARGIGSSQALIKITFTAVVSKGQDPSEGKHSGARGKDT